MRWILCASVLAGLSGCHAYTLDIDGRIAQRAAQPIDVQTPKGETLPPPVKATFGVPQTDGNVEAAVHLIQGEPKERDKTVKGIIDRIQAPRDLIGFEVEDIKLAPPKATPKEKEEAIKKQFPALKAMPKLPEAQIGPEGRPFSLSDLQQIALRTNPLIRQAHFDVEAARGLALQAKLYPNPTLGYEASTIGQVNTDGQRSPGQQGAFFEQTIVTMGKLRLAHEAGLRDVQISEQKLKQAEADVQAQVRKDYFAVLSAQKNFETTKALTQMTDELYNVLLLQLTAGEVAAYEPMQIRVLANQARNALTLAHNRYSAAWKQLAATLGTPGMPLTAVAGRIDMPVPHFEHDQVLAYVLSNHTDVVAVQYAIERTRLLARLAEVQPFPDVTLHVAFQKDYTTPPFGTVTNVNVGVPFPLFNRNQGNIQAMRAQVGKAMDDNLRVRNDLTRKVADVFERYDNNRQILDMYRKEILPNQVQAFRAAVVRHAAVADKSVSYNDLVTSQQTLAGLITSYLGALGDQWTAVVDIGNLLQTRDLFQTQGLDEVAPIPDVEEIFRSGLLRHRR